MINTKSQQFSLAPWLTIFSFHSWRIKVKPSDASLGSIFHQAGVSHFLKITGAMRRQWKCISLMWFYHTCTRWDRGLIFLQIILPYYSLIISKVNVQKCCLRCWMQRISNVQCLHNNCLILKFYNFIAHQGSYSKYIYRYNCTCAM